MVDDAIALITCRDPGQQRVIAELLDLCGFAVRLATSPTSSGAGGLLERARLIVNCVSDSVETTCQSIRELRDRGIMCPLLLIAPKLGPGARAMLIEAGANDVIGSECCDREFMARAFSLGLRTPQVLVAEPIRVDLRRKRVTVAGDEIKLRPKEFELLTYLVLNADSAVTAKELVERVLRVGYRADSSSIRVHMSQLRRKLGRADLIETSSPRTYRLRLGRNT